MASKELRPDRVEHAQVRPVIRALTAALDGGARRDVLGAGLQELRDRLAKRFAFEEEGHYLGLHGVGTGTRKELDRLQAQHSELLARLDALLVHLSEADSDASTEVLFSDARRLFADLEGHESAESTLLRDVVARDVGVGD